MELLVALGAIYGADRLVPSPPPIFGFYKTIGEGGIDFLEEWPPTEGRVPTTLNPWHGRGALEGDGGGPAFR
jgi:predicted aconitase